MAYEDKHSYTRINIWTVDKIFCLYELLQKAASVRDWQKKQRPRFRRPGQWWRHRTCRFRWWRCWQCEVRAVVEQRRRRYGLCWVQVVWRRRTSLTALEVERRWDADDDGALRKYSCERWRARCWWWSRTILDVVVDVAVTVDASQPLVKPPLNVGRRSSLAGTN